MNITGFTTYLLNKNLSKNTITAYTSSINHFFSKYKWITKQNLIQYKDFLTRNYKAQTVNLRIQGINQYLKFSHKEKLSLSFIKIQNKSFTDNIISNTDYELLKNQLKRDGKVKWHLIVWVLGATGMRIGELTRLKIEDVKENIIDLYAKGEKYRRIYLPGKLSKEIQKWLISEGRQSGYLFLNKYNKQISAKGIAIQLKTYAKKYKINPKSVHPHAFRHLFAKNFLSRCPDISLLADLLGHENLSTTRIYLRKTSKEQEDLINKTVTW